MTDSTAAFLASLTKIHWLKDVGRPAFACGGQIAADCKTAMQSLFSSEWSNFRLMLKNRNAKVVNIADYGRFMSWNPFVKLVRNEIEQHVSPAVLHALKDHLLDEKAVPFFTWDILNIAIELEYSDLISDKYFNNLIWPLYSGMRLPCGWTGPQIDEVWASGTDPLPTGSILYL